ncbi:hypothetical protein PFISCL1PPCAC_14422, partial [Pristionchus fissidentatus]
PWSLSSTTNLTTRRSWRIGDVISSDACNGGKSRRTRFIVVRADATTRAKAGAYSHSPLLLQRGRHEESFGDLSRECDLRLI